VSSRGITLSPVDEYLTGLSRALSGPRRRKADLIAEARDHLTDATEGFTADGLDRQQAERAAVADFGDLADVVPGYRAELAISQSRRTAVMLCMVLFAQPLVWREGLWSWNVGQGVESPANVFLHNLVEVVGTVSIAGSVLAVIAAGVGMRHPIVRDHVSRLTAMFAIASSVVISVIGLCMVKTGSHPSDLVAFGVVNGFVILPMLFVVLQARRCLRLTRAYA
jgi:hypothetical protein